jgi:hypothetical protein
MSTQKYNEANLRRCACLGKFEGELLLAKVLHDISLVGCNNTASSPEAGLWWGLMYGPFKVNDKSLNADELAFLESLAGVIIHENNELGFVSITYAAGIAELETAWAAIKSKLNSMATNNEKGGRRQ